MWFFAMLPLFSSGQIQLEPIQADPELEKYFESYFTHPPSFTKAELSAEMKAVEATYLKLKANAKTEEVDCLALLKSLGYLVWGSNSGITTILMPSLLDDEFPCDLESSYLDFILGCAHYDQGRYAASIALFERVLRFEGLSRQLHLMTRLNLASAYNAIEDPMKSIDLLEDLLELAKSAPYQSEVSDEWVLNVAVNLGAIHVTSGSYSLALQQFQAIDRDIISEYWRQIIDYNLLIVYLGLGDLDSIEEMWRPVFRNANLSDIPPSMHESLISASLLMNDFLFFEQLRNHMLSSSNLNASELDHGELLNPDLTHAELEECWSRHLEWERAYHQFLKRRAMDLAHVTDVRITELLEDLSRERERTEKLRLAIWWSVMCLGLVLTGMLIRLYLLRRRRESEWRQAFSQESPASNEEMFQINEEDVRLLGDAVTYGKRTSEAMLILRKLNASIRNEFDALEMEDLKLLDSADLMNSNDLKVLSYLAAGFDPKEIARITGLTVPTVYNISSRIRGKLNIPKGDRLKEWVHQEVKRLKSI
jgi:tetratricopeptide (TPR) repeat protein